MKLDRMEIDVHGGCEEAAELMAGVSILSDAQEMLSAGEENERINDTINHAKHHLINAYSLIHGKNKLPGKLFVSGAIPPGHEEKGG